MISIKKLNENDIELCYELDSNTISLWTKTQWNHELKKDGIKVIGLLISNLLIGICVFHIILDEAQIHFFVIDQKYRKQGFGSYFMNYIMKYCKKLSINKLFLEVSHTNVTAEKFYRRFNFSTIGVRKNYYKDGSDALLKEKILTTK